MGGRGQFSSLEEVHDRLRACRLCIKAGHEVVPKAIFSGSPRAEIMIIGQAPGVTEVQAGRPFNASSGTRLFEWLSGAGIEERDFRDNQYMTSVTKCFPGKAASGSGDRVPSRDERDLCRPYLEAEIRLVDPRVILPVGRLAINLFFPARHPLTKIIGTCQQVDGRWMVPLPHPSGASRWHQIPANRERIGRAIDLLARILTQVKDELRGR
jgi:uracil-DNA glycosylase